ncbi:uncharacterized protein Dwil_GK24941 [Drosophila willistoni]|uniref:RRM domain-containing protein n=1 Tax=Drosophila willistoni TaxID=7260 RepID=B4NDB3_DROWI|nr:uncharacterized protein Dwil_GK24941 [Drosophila willistoni]
MANNGDYSSALEMSLDEIIQRLRDDFFKRPLTTRNRRFAKSMGGHVKNLYVDYDDMSHLEAAAPARSFRVLVSNLAGDVTSHDIKELFADIGPIVDASVIRQGTAEVFYKCLKDAEKAVFVYHNRYFDNKPMHCVLVPSPYAKRFVLTNGSRAAFNSNHPDAVDVDAVHHALFGDT